jgi:hypothetical protein
MSQIPHPALPPLDDTEHRHVDIELERIFGDPATARIESKSATVSRKLACARVATMNGADIVGANPRRSRLASGSFGARYWS